jgi:predicted CXXCH cytochrome family protein
MPHRLMLALAAVIVVPPHQSVVKPGPLTIIAKAPEVRLDGKRVGAVEVAPGIVRATADPPPGTHEIAAGGETVRFFVGTGAPAGWKEFRPHPPGAACEACHARVSGAWEIRGGVLSGRCFQCHDQKAFPKAHQHNAELLADCQLCHQPHGSTETMHMALPRETACKQCHG